jgi:hypothetical protein
MQYSLIHSGAKYWYDGDRLHRTDGPAIEYLAGGKEWWLNGSRLTKTWFIAHPKKINRMKAWELFTPVEIVRMRLAV